MKPWMKATALAALSGVSLAGCVFYQAPVMPPPGLLFTSIKAPIDTDAYQTPTAMKSGSASTTGVLGLLAFGDASTATAAQNGNLAKIHHIDYEYLNVLFLFQRFTTVAYGE